MYERHKERILPRRKFVSRVATHLIVATAVISGALLIGVVGYHLLGDLPWVDSVLNAAMILGGMGPIDPLPSAPAKLFAAAYALFSGLIFIGVLGVVLAPFVHRMMHKFHLEGGRHDSSD
jgi:hypothetical protein